MTAILTCQELFRNFNGFALQNLSFSLEKGYLTGLIGKNGAGKTTLLKILAGLDSKFQGDVRIQGISLKAHPQKARELIGYVSEDLQLFWEKSWGNIFQITMKHILRCGWIAWNSAPIPQSISYPRETG